VSWNIIDQNWLTYHVYRQGIEPNLAKINITRQVRAANYCYCWWLCLPFVFCGIQFYTRRAALILNLCCACMHIVASEQYSTVDCPLPSSLNMPQFQSPDMVLFLFVCLEGCDVTSQFIPVQCFEVRATYTQWWQDCALWQVMTDKSYAVRLKFS